MNTKFDGLDMTKTLMHGLFESGSISSAAVRDYESGKQDFNGKSPAQILATTPIGNHPSSVAHKSAQQLKAWSGAVVHLHDGHSERRHHRKKKIVLQNEYNMHGLLLVHTMKF